MTRDTYWNGANSITSTFFFLGRENVKKLTLNKLYLMKFVFKNNEGRHIIKFENWKIKSNNVISFKNCIVPDIGEFSFKV